MPTIDKAEQLMTKLNPEKKRVHPKAIEASDVQVGQRIKHQRKLMRMSLTTLGEKLGITYQQVQKYESGGNRVSASRLQAAATIFGVPIGYFFAGDDGEFAGPGTGNAADAGVVSPQAIKAFLQSTEGQRLNKAFVRIENADTRRRLIVLIEGLG